MEVVVATRNTGKVKEIEAALAVFGYKLLSLEDFDEIPEPVENGVTFMENAILKAVYYAGKTGKACLADDSGLVVDALDGAPGVYSARYAGPGATPDERNAKLLKEMEKVADAERTARFCCAVALADTAGELTTAEGVCEGRIMREPAGSGGFGYDPLFFAQDVGKGLAEISLEEKNLISHRGRALQALAGILRGKNL